MSRGVGPGDAVVLVTANERESVIAYRAVVALGAVAVLTMRRRGPASSTRPSR